MQVEERGDFPMAQPGVPEGYHSVTPYMCVSDTDRLIEYLSEAFGAEVNMRMEAPDGRVAHAEVRIGDSMIMLTDGSDQLQPSVTGLYLYVPDVDESYRRAIAAGG